MIARQMINQGMILERKSAFVDDRFGAVSEHFDQFTSAELRGPQPEVNVYQSHRHQRDGLLANKRSVWPGLGRLCSRLVA